MKLGYLNMLMWYIIPCAHTKLKIYFIKATLI